MDAKVGDRISIDAKKVGQARRAGVVLDITTGLSGIRYEIRWDDGSRSVLAPSAGTLIVEGRSRGGNGKAKRPAAKKAAAKKPATKPAKAATKAAKKPAAKRTAGKKAAARSAKKPAAKGRRGGR